MSSPLPLMPPSNLRSPAQSSTSIELEWDPSPDASVTGYLVYLNGLPVAVEVEPRYLAAGLSSGSSYAFEISAADASGNESLRSGQLEVSTPPQPETEIISLSVQVAASTDDAEETSSSGGSVSLGSGALELGEDGSKLQMVGVRLRGVDIPPGVRIEGARLQFTADRPESSEASLIIEAEAADDAATFARRNGDVTDRPRTLAAVVWDPPAWTQNGASGADQRTPELTTIVQEIIDRPGWSAGNALVFLLSGSGE